MKIKLKNWDGWITIERELTNENIETELTIQKFVIFPRDRKIILKRKVEKEIRTVSIGFDFLKMNFYAERDDESSINIKSFNEYLITGILIFFNFK